MTTATTPQGREVEVVVTAEHGTAKLQSGQIRHGGVVVGHFGPATGSGPILSEAIARADEAIDKLGIKATPTSVRLSAEEQRALAEIAEREDRTVAYVMRRAVRREIERESAEQAQGTNR